MILKTLGEQDEKFVRRHPSGLSHNKLVVYGNKGSPHLVLAHADAPADHDQQGKKKSNDHTPDPPVKEEILASNNGANKGQSSADEEHDHKSEEDGHDEGKVLVDVGKADIRDKPERHSHNDQGHASQEQEKNKGSLLRSLVLGLGLHLFRCR
jgi:hypothetical protein